MADVNSITVNRIFLSRIFSKIHISTKRFHNNEPCWEWTAFINQRTGYGGYTIAKIGHFLPHRMFYELFVEPIPKHLICDHLCRNRICVNPVHLEPVTYKENQLRGDTIIAKSINKTHCKNGHAMTGDNVVVRSNGIYKEGTPKTRRDCRLCRNANSQRYFRKMHRKAS